LVRLVSWMCNNISSAEIMKHYGRIMMNQEYGEKSWSSLRFYHEICMKVLMKTTKRNTSDFRIWV
jgi:hypothetical protein